MKVTRDRLTERFSNGDAAVAGCGDNCKYNFRYCKDDRKPTDCPTLIGILEKLACYEDLEDDGKLCELPCKRNDIVCALVAFFVVDPTDCYQCPFGEGSLQCETCRIHKWKQKHGGNK